MASLFSLLLNPGLADARLPARVPADDAHRAQLGQYMTPARVAEHLAALFEPSRVAQVRLLDAGAGRGALSLAFAHRWASTATPGSKLAIDAYEIDPLMARVLRAEVSGLDDLPGASLRVIEGDFIAGAAAIIARGERPYSHAILNPPYKKIASNSAARLMLSSAGVETVNLYSGFVALALMLLEDQGELVAIIPRSFCNGPYYRGFRNLVLDNAAIMSVHLFKARNKAFAADNVLQENVIIRLKRGAPQGEVEIGSSTDASFSDLQRRKLPFEQIVKRIDPNRVIHVPIEEQGAALAAIAVYQTSLGDLGIQVSTGPVVDFRVRRFLRDTPASGDAALLYPLHFSGGKFEWPRVGARKANALALNAETARMVYPRGFYVVVRRFSSKEEARRIVASVVDPAQLPEPWIAFENHLNVFHADKMPLSEDISRGLALYLNSKIVDNWIRDFSGHTQVNATDLRALPLPGRARLQALGRWARTAPTQAQIDAMVADPK